MTADQMEMLVFVDQSGAYYLLSAAMLAASRLDAAQQAAIEPALGADTAAFIQCDAVRADVAFIRCDGRGAGKAFIACDLLGVGKTFIQCDLLGAFIGGLRLVGVVYHPASA
jgi:hypothetical protein